MENRFNIPYSHPRWWWEGDYIPVCFDCVHFFGRVNGRICCKAFPDGIPKELLAAGVIHDQPYEGDNGVQFAKQ